VIEIYDALKYKHQPFKKRKICSTQTHPPECIKLYSNKFSVMDGKLS